jgi:hypothetical protein
MVSSSVSRAGQGSGTKAKSAHEARLPSYCSRPACAGTWRCEDAAATKSFLLCIAELFVA